MQIAKQLLMLSVAVTDMNKAVAFYGGKLGLEVASDYSQDDDNRWVSLSFAGGISITLTTHQENMKPGTMKLYFGTSDVAAAHKELVAKGSKPGEIKDDLYGHGSGVKWLALQDPDGNQVLPVEG